MILSYNIILSNEKPNIWGAIVLELPGCIACGETENEVRELIVEAIDIHTDCEIDIKNKNFVNSGEISPALEKVIEYCHHLYKDSQFESQFESQFINSIQEQNLLYDITSLSYKLDIKPLLEMCCKIIANKIKGKTAEQIRNEFNLEEQ